MPSRTTKKTSKAKSKKKTETLTPESINVNMQEYGYNMLLTNMLAGMGNMWRGERIPTDPVEEAKFWKKKLDDEVIKSRGLSQQVDLLKGMIVIQMNRGNTCDC